MAAQETGFFPFWGVRGRRVAVLVISFNPNGSSAVTLTSKQKQRGLASVAYVSTGLYTLTLDQKYSSLLAWAGGVRSSAGQFTAQIMGVPSLGASGGATIPLQIFQAGSASDVAANADNEVSLILMLSKSSLEKERS